MKYLIISPLENIWFVSVQLRLLIFLVVVLSETSLYANDEFINLSQQIDILKTTQTATVVLARQDVAYRVGLNEISLRERGCTYITRDPSRISSLVDLLRRSDLNVEANDIGAWEPREGIFLNLDNGTEVKFIFSRKFINHNKITGTFIRSPSCNKISITAGPLLVSELTQWAVQTGVSEEMNTQEQIECTDAIH
ncbi:MAG: hypothetical protein HQL87_13005 [Magnetococcales bacterium]|nr:hypothetical protein [Magnetococcales bacterium]